MNKSDRAGNYLYVIYGQLNFRISLENIWFFQEKGKSLKQLKFTRRAFSKFCKNKAILQDTILPRTDIRKHPARQFYKISVLGGIVSCEIVSVSSDTSMIYSHELLSHLGKLKSSLITLRSYNSKLDANYWFRST